MLASGGIFSVATVSTALISHKMSYAPHHMPLRTASGKRQMSMLRKGRVPFFVGSTYKSMFDGIY